MSRIQGSGEFSKTLSCRVPEWVHTEIIELCEYRGEKVSDYLRDVFLALALEIKENNKE